MFHRAGPSTKPQGIPLRIYSRRVTLLTMNWDTLLFRHEYTILFGQINLERINIELDKTKLLRNYPELFQIIQIDQPILIKNGSDRIFIEYGRISNQSKNVSIFIHIKNGVILISSRKLINFNLEKVYQFEFKQKRVSLNFDEEIISLIFLLKADRF